MVFQILLNLKWQEQENSKVMVTDALENQTGATKTTKQVHLLETRPNFFIKCQNNIPNI